MLIKKEIEPAEYEEERKMLNQSNLITFDGVIIYVWDSRNNDNEIMSDKNIINLIINIK